MDMLVAGVPITVTCAHRKELEPTYAPYARQDGADPQMELTVTVPEEIPTPEGEVLSRVKAATVVRTPDGRLCRYGRKPDGTIFFATRFDEDYRRMEIALRADGSHPTMTNCENEYLLSGFAFQDRLTVLGGGVLHASSLRWRGHGIAFSADSGTGKSTHTGLWRQRFGDQVIMVNDDKPAIVFEGDRPILCGTPWSGKHAINENVTAPLEAIVFIERGAENSIRRLDTVESYFRLAGQIPRPYYDEALGVRVVEFTERLLATVPIYCLTCNISIEAVETVVRAVFPQEEI
ncbi:MAG: hypothetical protein IKU51_05925 [Clostridia bacterium]|nr:hypothetical protein [Clostridia bacterium]